MDTAASSSPPARVPPPLLLLARVNTAQMWRRLQAVREQSRLLTGVIALFMAGYLALSFWIFYKGLLWCSTHFPGLGSLLLERLLFLLFAFLFVLLLLSNVVIGYSNLFRNRETLALMSLPVSAQAIFRWKFIESTVLASWAFLFLIAPFLAAYGLTRGLPWHFYPFTLVLVGLFIVLPGVVGTWVAVAVARHIDRRIFQVAAVLLALGALGLAARAFRPEPPADEMIETRVLEVLDKILTRTRLAQYPLLPSYWLSSGVLQWAEGAKGGAVFFALVLLSNALFFGALAFTRTGRFFYDAFSAVQSRGSVFADWGWFRARRRRTGGTAGVPGLMERLAARLPWLGVDTRAMMVKDARMFWRDTTQWGQSVMLFGLLGVYIINLRHFSQQITHPFWTDLISYLNLGACALNLATITTRFVYPQFSLDGKRLWIVGLAPLGLAGVLKTKLALALTTALALTLSLIWLSCRMLELSAARTVYFAVAIAVMACTLTALAVGLGALYPNFKEENPGKIVSGFGGTFCLVLSFVYILGSVGLLAWGSPWGNFGVASYLRSLGCMAGFVALSFALGWVPLRLGLRRVKTFEL